MSVAVFRPCVRSALGRTAGGFKRCRTSLGTRARERLAVPVAQFYSNPSNNDSELSAASSTSHSSQTASSVSASEVSHFSNLASSWWDPHGPSRLLHLMNPLRHDFIKSCLQSSQAVEPQNEKEDGAIENGTRSYTCLDIGCGGGIFASSAARLPNTERVVAIDPTPSVITVAKEHQRRDPSLNTSGKLTYLNCAIEDLSTTLTDLPDHLSAQNRGRFDIITTFEVLEHIPPSHLPSFLSHALSHLKPGGWLIGSTISRHPLSYITTKLIAEAPWPLGVVPRGTHDWDQYIRPDELGAYFQTGSGVEGTFGPVKVEGCVYIPVWGWRWIKGSEDVGNYFFGVQKLSR